MPVLSSTFMRIRLRQCPVAPFHCSALCSTRRSRHTGAQSAMQRFAPSLRHGIRASSRTFRPPTQNLLSPFGSVLHGATRGQQASFAEPPDAWLAVLADSVPFYKDCLVICPSTSSRAQVQRVWDRCRAHIPAAHVGTLRPRAGFPHPHGRASLPFNAAEASETAPSPLPLLSTSSDESVSASTSAVSAPHASTSSPSSSLVVPVTSAPSALARRTSLPALRSPLEDVRPHSLDLVVLVNNVFAQEMLFDAPWHLSLAHRALRPHGVVAIIGHVAEAEVVAPAWAAESCMDCLAGLHEEARHDATLAARDDVRAMPSSTAHVCRLQHALEVQETLRTAHGDVFFPFPGVRRRWFTSEYAMDPAQVAASYRAAPVYQALFGPAGSLWRSNAQYTLRQRSRTSDAAAGDGYDSDGSCFVDITASLFNEAGNAKNASNASSRSEERSKSTDSLATSWSPLGVQRRRGVVDPLDAMQAILEAHVGRTRTRPTRATEPPLRVQMRHFIVTCSSRSINVTSNITQPSSSPPFRLPGTKGGQESTLLPSSHNDHSLTL